MKRTSGLFFILLFWLPLQLTAQLITVSPADFTLDDEITIVYNASLGNKALLKATGPVYLRTGVVNNVGVKEWQKIQGSLAKPEERLRMQPLANQQYQFKFRPRDFYGLGAEEEPEALVFEFHTADGKLIGKNADGTSIYLPVPSREDENITFSDRTYQSHTFENGQLVIKTNAGNILVQAVANGITKVSLSSKSHLPATESYSVVLTPEQQKVQIKDQPAFLLYDTDEMDVYVQKSPLQLKFIQQEDTVLREERGFYESDATVGARFRLNETEALYGTGSRAIAYNRRGRELKLNNEAHYGYTGGAAVLNISVPFLVSSRGYGIFFDNHYEGRLDAAASTADVVDWRFKGGPATYYVITSKDFPQLLNRYTALTGKQPLPPMWALGYLQSKYGYKDEAETRGIVKRLQAENFPLDAVVLDLYWFGVEGDMGRLDWDKTKFPTAQAMIADLKKSGVKTILITEPYFTRTSTNFKELVEKKLLVQNEQGEPYIIEDFWTGAAALIDMTKPEAQQWMWQFYKKHIQTGVAGWWSDLGEPENHPAGMRHQGGLKPYEVHNIYGHLWAKMIYTGYATDFPDQRVFNLSRSGFAGTQRYAVFPWSGDIERSWSGFQAQIPLMISMSMSGYGYMHSDLGGFTGNDKNPELYARWLQMGAFVPVMRAHGAGGVPSEPVFYDEPVKSIVRNYINLRYQLLPYVYTLAWRNANEGMPLVLPMNFYDHRNPRLQDINDQYYWGENMLVAPVLEPGISTRMVVLPSGSWTNYWTGQTYAGLQNIVVATPLERMPLFIKGGSFIPMTSLRKNLDEYRSDTLKVQFYAVGAPASSNYTLYLDNGKSTRSDAFELLKFNAKNQVNSLTLNVNKEGTGYEQAPAQRLLQWEVLGAMQQPEAVSWNGELMRQVNAKKELTAGTYWYDNPAKRIYAYVNYSEGSASLKFEGLETGKPIEGVSITEGLEGTAVPIGETSDAEMSLAAGAPRASSPATDIVFVVPRFGDYTLEVRDPRGRTVFLKRYYGIAPGRYSQRFSGYDYTQRKLRPGTYKLVLTSSTGQKTEELILKK